MKISKHSYKKQSAEVNISHKVYLSKMMSCKYCKVFTSLKELMAIIESICDLEIENNKVQLLKP